MPPISGIAGAAADLSSGASAINASVVISTPATDPAFCKLVLTTLVGSIIPALNISTNLSFCASYPTVADFSSFNLPTITGPSTPALFDIVLIGASNALLTISTPAF